MTEESKAKKPEQQAETLELNRETLRTIVSKPTPPG